MVAYSIRRIDEQDHQACPQIAMQVVGAVLDASSSPVAAMQHRIERAALRGFFDKRPARAWHGGFHRLAVVAGAAASSWIVIFAAIYGGMH